MLAHTHTHTHTPICRQLTHWLLAGVIGKNWLRGERRGLKHGGQKSFQTDPTEDQYYHRD